MKNVFWSFLGSNFVSQGLHFFFPDSQKRGASLKKNRRCKIDFDRKSVQKLIFRTPQPTKQQLFYGFLMVLGGFRWL